MFTFRLLVFSTIVTLILIPNSLYHDVLSSGEYYAGIICSSTPFAKVSEVFSNPAQTKLQSPNTVANYWQDTGYYGGIAYCCWQRSCQVTNQPLSFIGYVFLIFTKWHGYLEYCCFDHMIRCQYCLNGWIHTSLSRSPYACPLVLCSFCYYSTLVVDYGCYIL